MVEWYIKYSDKSSMTPPEKVGTIFMITKHQIVADLAREMEAFEVTAVSAN